MLFNFKKLEPSDVYDMGTPYDFSSMLHYDSNSFSANGQPTMININRKYVIDKTTIIAFFLRLQIRHIDE